MRKAISERLDRDSTAWIAGVALPAVMLVLDPAVFRTNSFSMLGAPMLGAFRPFGYVAIGSGLASVIVHLLHGRQSAFLAGILMGASAFAIALGVILLPLTFIGTFFLGVGLLGLSPFVSGTIVGRRARKAYSEASGPRRAASAFLGFVMFFGVCTVAQVGASAALKGAVRDISSGQPDLKEVGIARLARWSPLLDLDELVPVWLDERDTPKKERIAAAYRRLTGASIEERAASLVD